MDIKQVKFFLGKTVFYDTGQMNIDGCSIGEFTFTACILRKDKKGHSYYQAELEDIKCKKSVVIVPLEKVLTRDQVWKRRIDMNFQDIKNIKSQWIWDNHLRTFFWILSVDKETKCIKARGVSNLETEFFFEPNRFFKEIRKCGYQNW